MAIRKPLVLVNGETQQLQAGDSLSSPDIFNLTNDEAGPIVIGTPVYSDAAGGVKKAKGDAAGTKNVVGLVRDVSIATTVAGAVQTDGVLTATTAQWDAVFGTTGGLTFNTVYWLSPSTSGQGTATVPSTTGQYLVRLGIALSTTDLDISAPFTSILL